MKDRRAAGPRGMRRGKVRGYTYLVVLFAVIISTAGLAGAVQLWSFAQQREREVELLFVGAEFRRAIGLYYERTPGVAKRYPAELAELLKDNRFPGNQRYLRRLYPDPMTGKAEWGLVRAPEGGIMGVYSLSTKSAIKTAGFNYADRGLTGKGKYSDWQFTYAPVLPAAPVPATVNPIPAQGPGAPGQVPIPTPVPAKGAGG